MIRIGIVGAGRILNAHLQGYLKLRRAGVDNFRIVALCARKHEDALMFHKRGYGPTPRPPVLDSSTGDPLAAPHTYISDINDDDTQTLGSVGAGESERLRLERCRCFKLKPLFS